MTFKIVIIKLNNIINNLLIIIDGIKIINNNNNVWNKLNSKYKETCTISFMIRYTIYFIKLTMYLHLLSSK